MTNVRPLKARITNGTGTTRVDVYDDIGDGGWLSEGLTAKSFANQLSGVSGPLEVHINSGGGDVWDGISIKNAIEAHKGPVTTVVDGIAASIASIIAQAGTDRVMMPGSMMMIHDAFTVAGGNAAELAKMAATLDEVSGNLATIYARSAGGTAEQWRDAMKEETWYTAEQAVTAGLADRTGDGEAALPPGLDLAAFAAAPGQIAAALQVLPRLTAAAVAVAPAHTATGDQDGDADHDHNNPSASGTTRIAATAGRVLGIESMPLLNKALPVHHTATVDTAWDGPAAVAAMPNDDAVLRYCHAWMSHEAAAETPKEGDDDADDQKASYKFPHHATKGGPANLAACRNGLARLSGADIPDADRAGVKAHLQAHLDDADSTGAGETHDHAGLPGWLHNETTHPAWLGLAEEAK